MFRPSWWRAYSERICSGICLFVVLLGLPSAEILEAKEEKPFWKQISGNATETVFLRRVQGPVICTDDMPSLSAGDLLRTRPFLHTDLASMTLFTRDGTGDSMEIYPGSIIAIDGDAVRLDLGRMRLVASGGAGLTVDLRRGILEMPEGELLIETDPKRNVTLAFRRGTGWIKMEDRTIRKLASGKQYNIPKYGNSGKPVEITRMWSKPPEFWIMPKPPMPPTVADNEEDAASDTSEIASEVPEILREAPESIVSTETGLIPAGPITTATDTIVPGEKSVSGD